MCASRLDCHALTATFSGHCNEGSFQRDSALWSSHLEYSGFIAAGPNHRGRS